MSNRPSICYAAPGHALLGTSGATSNILSVAAALSQWADVTVAFRSIRQPIESDKFRVISIDPEFKSPGAEIKDDVAARGFNVFAHVTYLRKLLSFSKSAKAYDLVLEKGWRLSGLLSSAFRRRGVPSVVIENDVRYWHEPIRSARAIAKYGMHGAAQGVAAFCSRRTALVIAETEELKAMLIARRKLAPENVEVVELGVNHSVFRPMNQSIQRERLKIEPDAIILLYVGGLDRYHDLAPIIRGLTQVRTRRFELHIVGDGEDRSGYEKLARGALIPIRFHGTVPHERVPEFIAAADLCLAPYRIGAFPDDSVYFATMKIPEYMACGRPAVSVPSGHIKKLIKDQVSGFLCANDVESWVKFLETLPSRERIQEIGAAAAREVESKTWENTAARYLEVCQRLTVRQLLPDAPDAALGSR